MRTITQIVLGGVVLCCVAAVACSGVKKVNYAPANTKHTFTVHFDGGCPVDALMEEKWRNCPGPPDPECVAVDKTAGHKVVVVADPANPHDFGVDKLGVLDSVKDNDRQYQIKFDRAVVDAGIRNKFSVTGTNADGTSCAHDPTVVIGH
jgi:hypothetical protein